MDIHEKYMRRTFALAKQGLGSVTPNPLVGAVVVKNGKVIAEGYHQCCGGDHAERDALKKLARKGSFKNCARGASIYISLEPCSHHGRTPPCTDLLLEAGIKKVYFAIRDPHPAVRAKDSVTQLEAAGIAVHYPLLEKEARELNKVFFTNVERGRPYIIWKAGMSLDGKIATARGESKWITGEVSRAKAQNLRYSVDAILVGANTVIQDDPSLDCRLPDKEKTLIKLVLGDRKKMPKHTKLLKDPYALFIPHPKDLKKTLEQLYQEQKVCSILVEGGGAINDSFLRAGLVDEFYLFVAPKIIGGQAAVSVVGGKGILALRDALLAKNLQASTSGEDLLLHGYF